ncbi:MAG: hypothetical protein L6Q76_06870 [Polyangiaceae bacterium]|nr:hypothetical protein [Polyangiaceae bacterium]
MPRLVFSTGDPREVAGALSGLVNANLAVLQDGYRPDVERLKRLRYVEDPAGEDEWVTIQKLIERGAGDCEDLAAAWTACLLSRGVGASMWVAVLKPYKRRYHGYLRVQGRAGNVAGPGRLFDPSVVGGMRPLPMVYYAPANGRIVASGGDCDVVVNTAGHHGIERRRGVAVAI